MAFVRLATAFLLLQLSLLLCTSFTVYGDGSVDGFPSHPPYKPPYKPPVKPPCKAAAVQGVVYCKSCKYRGFHTVKGASPLAGAVVKLQCSNGKHSLVVETKTDRNGNFFFMPPKLTTDEAHKCRVFLVSSPLYKCSVATNINGGTAGAILIPAKNPPTHKTKKPVQLYTVGPFAFEPRKKLCYYC